MNSPPQCKVSGMIKPSQIMSLANRTDLLMAVWFVIVMCTSLDQWGLNPTKFSTPDEMLNRFAAANIYETGAPFIQLPFADTEDMIHPRFWVSLDDRAIPSYPPFFYYICAALMHLGQLGFLMIIAIPASGAAAFAGGTAKLLPKGRRWLAYFSPLLGVPATFWLMRPWINMSFLLACLCWSFFCWAHWRKSLKLSWLFLSFLGVGAAASARPDYAAYLFIIATLLTLSSNSKQYIYILIYGLISAALAVGVNLYFNRIVSGHALLAPYQVAFDRANQMDSAMSNHQLLLQVLKRVLLPLGKVPDLTIASKHLFQYWIMFKPINILTVMLLICVPWLFMRRRSGRGFLLSALVSMVLFMVMRSDAIFFGATAKTPSLLHSMPRYWSFVYLFAAVPPLLFLADHRNRILRFAVMIMVIVLSVSSVAEVSKENFGIDQDLRSSQRIEKYFALRIPSDTIIYGLANMRFDKTFWPRWRVAVISTDKESIERTATSMDRAIKHDIPVLLIETSSRKQMDAFANALMKKGLILERFDISAPGIHSYKMLRVVKSS